LVSVTPANATLAPSYRWWTQAHVASGLWTSPEFTSGEELCAAFAAQLVGDDNMNAWLGYWPGTYMFRNVVVTIGVNGAWPSYTCPVSYEYTRSDWNGVWDTSPARLAHGANYSSTQVFAFVTDDSPPEAQCELACVGDPISPTTGGVHEAEAD